VKDYDSKCRSACQFPTHYNSLNGICQPRDCGLRDVLTEIEVYPCGENCVVDYGGENIECRETCTVEFYEEFEDGICHRIDCELRTPHSSGSVPCGDTCVQKETGECGDSCGETNHYFENENGMKMNFYEEICIVI
jgi:hypothetical protein